MKCEYCDRELPHVCEPSDPNYILCEKNKEGKMFCNFQCIENFYCAKIAQLTKAEKAWHEAWYKQREIIGRLGCHGIKSINEKYEDNRNK